VGAPLRRLSFLTLAVALLVTSPLASATASASVSASASASALAAQQGCAQPTGVYADAPPWPQRLVEAERIWPLTTGEGQLVAVVGTGVDANNPQFADGQLRPAIDAQGKSVSGDCDGRGTFAAGIVAANPDPSTTFRGIAPGARILPIKYTQATQSSNDGGDPNALASAINQAVRADATVILIVVPAVEDSAALRAAVAQAIEDGVVIVSPAVSSTAGAKSYPTATPGVIGVGAVSSAGEAVAAEFGDYISVAAPGDGLVGTSPGTNGKIGHTWLVKDPSFAAAYVAGVVTLLRAYRPALTPEQVATRLELTASRSPSGKRDPRRGWGLIDAYNAVSAEFPDNMPGPEVAPPPPPPARVVPMAAAQEARDDSWIGGVVVIFGLIIAAGAGAAAAAIRRGRSRGWRVGGAG
jgi:membrane-anchored mycosin MYCP